MRKSLEKVLDRLTYTLLMPLHKMVVFALGLYTLVWGLWVANPIWSVFEQADLYVVMAQVAPEWAWGLLAVVCGSSIIWGALRMSYKSLVGGAQLSFCHWLLVAIFYFIGDFHNTGGITSLFIAGYSAWVALNLKVNHKNRGLDMPHMFSE
jgi:hypothetical protein